VFATVENTMFRLRVNMVVRRGWQGEKISPPAYLGNVLQSVLIFLMFSQ